MGGGGGQKKKKKKKKPKKKKKKKKKTTKNTLSLLKRLSNLNILLGDESCCIIFRYKYNIATVCRNSNIRQQ